MRRNRYAAIAAGVAGVAMLVSACGASGASNDAGDRASGELSGKISFQTWNLKNEKFTPYFESLIKEFESENPGTTIKWVDQPAEGYQEKLSADAAAGSLPDVVDMGPEAAYTLAQAGVILDVAAEDPKAQDLYLPKSWDAMTFKGVKGGTYGYPWYLNTGPSFFNTKLFEECGLDPANLPATYDELFEQSKTLREKCPDKAMIARTPAIENFGEYGVPLMNDKGTKFTYNDAKGVELVEQFVALYEGKGLTEESLNNLQTNEAEEFKAGRVAYLPGSSYTLNDLKETAPAIYDSIAMGPRINNAAPNMYIESLVVNADTENKALATAFAKYVTNSANQFEFAKAADVFPSSAGTLEDPYFTTADGTPETQVRVDTAAQVNEAVVLWPPAFSGAADAEALREQVALALIGKKSAQEALDASVEYSNSRLAGN